MRLRGPAGREDDPLMSEPFPLETVDRVDRAEPHAIAVGDHRPVQIWGVAVDGALYAQSWRGTAGSGWRQALLDVGRGRLHAGDEELDVAGEPVEDEGTRDAILAAIEAKYTGEDAQWVGPFREPASRATAIRLVPTA